jgi:chromosome segregation ATPase
MALKLIELDQHKGDIITLQSSQSRVKEQLDIIDRKSETNWSSLQEIQAENRLLTGKIAEIDHHKEAVIKLQHLQSSISQQLENLSDKSKENGTFVQEVQRECRDLAGRMTEVIDMNSTQLHVMTSNVSNLQNSFNDLWPAVQCNRQSIEELQKISHEAKKRVGDHEDGLEKTINVMKKEEDSKKEELHIRIKAAEDQLSLMAEQVAQLKNYQELSNKVTLLEERSEVDRKLFEDQQINGQENFILLNGKVDNITKESFDRMNSDKEMKNKIEHLIKDSESYAMSIQMYHQDTEKLSSRQNNFDDILVAVQNKLDKLNERTDGEEKTFNKQIKNEIEEQK